ncbi:hypothetical protein LTR37_012399 [Vermiconidia calcicola]|uniref:Uncharacterized protein n=1 Tax=Vermiconidia calcicola TaxID=1690605 RepID=A0ACC3MZH5_9PEZI|nr:hypothetical protein LTR37_012399 [Vermiconidia calcicola]
MNPADLTLNTSSTITSKPIPAPLSLTQKTAVPRVDIEPIYTQLKGALGDQWADYKAAVNAFVLGTLNQSELTWLLSPLLSPAPSVLTSANSSISPVSTLYLHNTLLAALFANTLRDPPPSDVAPWVVATDKPTATSKAAGGASGANDKAEERLKRETMAIHPRDRRRIKTLKETAKPLNDGLAEIQDYRAELAVKPPDVAPQSAGGLTRTNWDVEIRRRYAQPLAEETLEFPTQSDMQNRIEPICYEEGLVGGCAQGSLGTCGEIMEQATEVFLKELLSSLNAHSRANAEGCIQTGRFKRQLRKEETESERGVSQRNAAGLLPVELEVQSKREALEMDDMRLALHLSDNYMKQDPFLGHRVMLNRYQQPAPEKPKVNGIFPAKKPTVSGVLRDDANTMVLDDPEFNWRGATKADADDLMSVLGDCLAVG